MKFFRTLGIATPALIVVLALPVATAASSGNNGNSEKIHYTIVDLGPLGGPAPGQLLPPPGQPYMIASNGLAAGYAAQPDGAYYATLWFYKARLDIGTLGGTNSEAFGINERGNAVGAAQTSNPDDEDFCGFNASGFKASSTACRAFVWHDGRMHALPTLSGPNGYASMINGHSEIAGYAETSRKDAGCPVHRFRPVVWEDGNPHVLPTPGDSYGLAAYINEKGQAVGASGTCGSSFNTNTGTYLIENHPLRWDSDGTPQELGTFGEPGGLSGNHACALNNRGEAVGHLMLTNDPAGPFHAVRWPEGTDMPEDLGTLPGDAVSLALSINDYGKVVGWSADANFNGPAVIWQNGAAAPTDLNTLIRGNASLYLLLATSINNAGEIVGYAATSAGEIHGFLAVACEGDLDPTEDAGDSAAMARPVLPDEARQILRRQLAQHHVSLPQ